MTAGQVEERIDVCDGQVFGAIGDLHNFVAGSDLTLLQNTEIKSGPVMCDKKGRHTRLVHANANPVAGYAWLRDLKHRATDAIAVSDADFIVEKIFDSEIFSELPEGEICAAKLLLPVVIGIHLIDEHRPVLSTMTNQICLLIAIDIELADHSPPLNREFPDRCSDSFSVPRNCTRPSDIYR